MSTNPLTTVVESWIGILFLSGLTIGLLGVFRVMTRGLDSTSDISRIPAVIQRAVPYQSLP